VEEKILTLEELIGFLTAKPAEAFSLPYGKIEKGAIADLVLIDLEEEKKIEPEEFLSKGKNTPFKGWNCKGWPVMTIAQGKIAWQKGSGQE
jgi:dihydroorotase